MTGPQAWQLYSQRRDGTSNTITITGAGQTAGDAGIKRSVTNNMVEGFPVFRPDNLAYEASACRYIQSSSSGFQPFVTLALENNDRRRRRCFYLSLISCLKIDRGGSEEEEGLQSFNCHLVSVALVRFCSSA